MLSLIGDKRLRTIQRSLTIFKKKKKKKDAEPDQGNATADETVKAEDTEAEGSDAVGKSDKKAAPMGLKNLLVMIVVAIISIGCSFVFVTKFHSSKDVYDITSSDAAPTSESTGEGAESLQDDGKDSGTEDGAKSEKVKSKKKDKKKDGEDSEEESNSVLGKILVPMDSIVVNIGKVDSKRYLRVIISLEVKNEEVKKTIKANKVVFRDKLVSFLSSKSLEEISNRANHQELRIEIRDMLNSTLLESKDAISQVYFSDFIIQ